MIRSEFTLSLRIFIILLILLVFSVPGESQQIQYPGLSTANVFTNSNQYQNGIFLGPQVFANLGALVGFTNFVYLTDGLAGSNPCAGGGTGAFALYINGAWNCAGAGGGVLAYPAAGIAVSTGASWAASLAVPLAVGNGGTGTNTVPSSGQLLVGNGGGTAYAPRTLSGDGSVSSTGVLSNTGLLTHALPGLATGYLNWTGAAWNFGNPIPLSSGTPQVGDILRYNVNGDNAWDAVNWAQTWVGIYAQNQTANLSTSGTYGVGGAVVTGSTSDALPTATSQAGKIISAAATASPLTVIGYHFVENGSTALLGMLAFNRWSSKWAAGVLTNARYWMGWGCVTSAGAVGNNSAAITGTTAYATDTPNKTTLGFRFSAGTDTHWQAVAFLASGLGGTSTIVDTGVTPDTNPHLFEMTTNAAGTAISYFIDRTLVATISSNLPDPATNGNSWGDIFFTGDNKNTNNAISATFYWAQVSLK